ncbi:MAG TPA: NUDIX domain-containing protein [Anaerolineales bacterium]|nr:NUDIX domain-containing protein [Anaerolineales bacterium]
MDKIPVMKILTEIHRSPGVNIQGKTVYRTAVKGVILRGRTLLMVYSSKVDDYDFPGGGLHEGETHSQGLYREILEGCGMSVAYVGPEVGVVVEYDVPIEPGYDVFKMTSHYYQCEVQDGLVQQKLEDYEQELGFTPVWVDLDHALQRNRTVLHSDNAPKWLKKEVFVLEYIRRSILLTLEP